MVPSNGRRSSSEYSRSVVGIGTTCIVRVYIVNTTPLEGRKRRGRGKKRRRGRRGKGAGVNRALRVSSASLLGRHDGRVVHRTAFEICATTLAFHFNRQAF